MVAGKCARYFVERDIWYVYYATTSIVTGLYFSCFLLNVSVWCKLQKPNGMNILQ